MSKIGFKHTKSCFYYSWGTNSNIIFYPGGGGGLDVATAMMRGVGVGWRGDSWTGSSGELVPKVASEVSLFGRCYNREAFYGDCLSLLALFTWTGGSGTLSHSKPSHSARWASAYLVVNDIAQPYASSHGESKAQSAASRLKYFRRALEPFLKAIN